MTEFKRGDRVTITDRYVEAMNSHNFGVFGNLAEFDGYSWDGYCVITFQNCKTTVLPVNFIRKAE